MDKLLKHLRAVGLNPIVIDETTDFSTLEIPGLTKNKPAEPLPVFAKSAATVMPILRQFVPFAQMRILCGALCGAEREHFNEILYDLGETIRTMPKTYETDGQGDSAVVQLHYFCGSCDWWITEKDVEPEQLQAFGLASLGYEPELGYISIAEICRQPGAEIDLYWKPITIGQVKKTRSL